MNPPALSGRCGGLDKYPGRCPGLVTSAQLARKQGREELPKNNLGGSRMNGHLPLDAEEKKIGRPAGRERNVESRKSGNLRTELHDGWRSGRSLCPETGALRGRENESCRGGHADGGFGARGGAGGIGHWR